MLCGDGGLLLRDSGLLLSDQRRELAHLSREVVEVGGRTSVFHDLYNVRHTKKFPHTVENIFQAEATSRRQRRRCRTLDSSMPSRIIANSLIRSSMAAAVSALSSARGNSKVPASNRLYTIIRPSPDERKHFHAVAAAIKKQKEMARLHRLPQLAFDDADQTR